MFKRYSLEEYWPQSILFLEEVSVSLHQKGRQLSCHLFWCKVSLIFNGILPVFAQSNLINSKYLDQGFLS